MPQTDRALLSRAKAMRSEMTQPERELWTALRGKRLNNVKFVRQLIIGSYIVDFAARSHALVVEVDGDTHADPAVSHRRDERLKQHGYRVLHVTNAEVMTNIDGVLTRIIEELDSAPLPTLSPEGRGL